MNEKLKKEIHDFRYKLIAEKYPNEDDVFIKECDWEDDIETCAEQFYSLALEDVKKELERQYVYWDNVMISSASPNVVASKNRIKELLDFVNTLTK